MATKEVTDCQKSADAVVVVGETHADLIADSLEALFQPHLKEGETMPDIRLFVHLSTRVLDASKDTMVDRDAIYAAELDDDPAVRDARDTSRKELYSYLVDLREIMIGAYGSTTAAKIFTGSTPEDPVVLSRFAGEVASKLTTTTFPKPRIKGATLDAGQIAGEIQDKRGELDKNVKAVAREVREGQVALDDKNASLNQYYGDFAWVARHLEALLLSAKRPELAAKVKPSKRRAGQTASDAGEEATEPAVPQKDQ